MAAQYTQPTTPYPQYPQTATPYPATNSAYPYVAQQQQPADTMPAPQRMTPSAAKPADSAPMSGAPAASSTSAAVSTSAAQPGGCNCSATYGAGDYYNAPGCGCNGGTYPDCGISSYFGLGESCNETQWFGGVYFMEMGRTNDAAIKLTAQVPTGSTYPFYPDGSTTVLSNRDVSFDFREGLEVRVGSTFTIGEPCGACDSCSNGYGFGYGGNGCSGCGSCAPTIFAWEVAWWGINNDANTSTAVYDGTNRIFGMKNFVGLQYDRDGAGGAYAYNPVNDYYGYALPIQATPAGPPDGYIQVQAQRVRSDFKAQNLELNVIRFPVCDTCAGSCNGGCNSGCNGGCDTCGCNANYTGCNTCGCDDGCASLGFSMYGSCGVRYFHVVDYLSYDTEFGEASGGVYDQLTYNGFTFDNSNELCYDIDVKNNLVGPQVGWTTDYCYGKWNVFCNSTFGIFNNHMTSFQRVWSGGGGTVTFTGDGSSATVGSHKDAVAFLGELRTGVSYDLTCHWRAVAAYRAVAITGLASASGQMPSDFTNRESVAIIDSDNSAIIHGAQVGAECRY